jgi:hypothetical protein
MGAGAAAGAGAAGAAGGVGAASSPASGIGSSAGSQTRPPEGVTVSISQAGMEANAQGAPQGVNGTNQAEGAQDAKSADGQQGQWQWPSGQGAHECKDPGVNGFGQNTAALNKFDELLAAVLLALLMQKK